MSAFDPVPHGDRSTRPGRRVVQVRMAPSGSSERNITQADPPNATATDALPPALKSPQGSGNPAAAGRRDRPERRRARMVEGQGAMRVGVFCGSSSGNDPAFSGFARQTGRFLAESSIEVVYGGGRVGLMGALADGVLDAGGRITGVMPRALIEREIAHERLTELHVVETMHERKAAMAERATAFVALPGGAGTLEEIFEQWTWAQLGIHAKPCAFLNFRGYFEPIRDMVRQMVGAGFLHADYAGMLIFAETLEDLIDRFRSYVPTRPKWHDAAGKWTIEP